MWTFSCFWNAASTRLNLFLYLLIHWLAKRKSTERGSLCTQIRWSSSSYWLWFKMRLAWRFNQLEDFWSRRRRFAVIHCSGGFYRIALFYYITIQCFCSWHSLGSRFECFFNITFYRFKSPVTRFPRFIFLLSCLLLPYVGSNCVLLLHQGVLCCTHFL